MLETLQARAPAKINLVLEVLGRREDGYHEIDTVLQTLQLADTVTLRPRQEPGILASGPYASGTPADHSNLALRAAAELRKRIPGVPGAVITLDKQIPPAAGLGGGASDAATTLRLLQRALPGVSDGDLAAAAAAIGSDPPFFLVGGTARATGRGEQVEAIQPLNEHGVVLFLPHTTLERKTARLFTELGKLPFDDGSVAPAFVASPPAAIRGSEIYNAFERVAFDVFPGLASLWEDLETRIREPIHLAGAGPSLFWIGPPEEAFSVAARAEGLACTVILTRTSPSLWRP